MNKEEQKKAQQARKEAWQYVMGSNQGRLVLRDILSITGLGLSPFNGATNQTVKNVGMQDVGRLMTDIMKQHAFDDYIRLVKEEHEHVR